MPDDVAKGSYWFIAGQPDVVALIGAFPADDPDNAGIPWIFVRNVFTRMEDISTVKGSQAVALVLSNAGQSSSPLDYSTVRFQRLEVDIWVDPLRDALGNVTNPSETEGRGLDIFAAIDSHLHRAAANEKTQQWGDLITVSSSRMTEPVWYPVPDGDGLIRGVVFYDVGCFGNSDPTVQVGAGDTGSGVLENCGCWQRVNGQAGCVMLSRRVAGMPGAVTWRQQMASITAGMFATCSASSGISSLHSRLVIT